MQEIYVQHSRSFKNLICTSNVEVPVCGDHLFFQKYVADEYE